MVQYRRNYVPGGTYFFTVNLQNRSSDLLVTYYRELRESFRKTKSQNPFHIDAIVVLPDHIHAIFTLPQGDSDYSTRWQMIKTQFTQALIKKGALGEGMLSPWQNRFWEHTIRNERDFESHSNYIHFNPVKHGYVNKPEEWPYSSIHSYVKKGLFKLDKNISSSPNINFGE